MMKRPIIALVILLLCLFVGQQQLAAQSPWLRSKAGFLAQLSYQIIPEYRYVYGDKRNEKHTLAYKLQEQTLQFYGEYGLDKQNLLILSLPLRHLRTGAIFPNVTEPFIVTSGSKWALGNAQIGWRRAILSKRLKLSAQMLIELPSPSHLDEAGLVTGYNAWAAKPSLALGRGYRRAFWQGHIGYGLRSGGYSHFVSSGAEGGLKYSKWWFIAFTDVQYALANGDVELDDKQLLTSLYVNDQSYWAAGGKIIYEPSRFVGIVGSFATAFAAQYLPKSPSIGLGVYFKWQ